MEKSIGPFASFSSCFTDDPSELQAKTRFVACIYVLVWSSQGCENLRFVEIYESQLVLFLP